SVTYINPQTSGSLSFTPVANASGTATITVTVKDNGGTANNGHDTTVTTFLVIISNVNQAPTLDSIPNPAAILVNSPSQTIQLTGISAGPASESLQTVTISAISN